ncbi:hypothetical protein K1T35_13100 [Pseudonocardia sp. DSM 110487]|uniref:hypothetical protein n=1 Tax=Pseudonocardia sp. DSM 110487 TaxID=2865833 RepID=UPI001C694878|nr:hypothetical protein [Pseudonocardia sp. DSM 110487]QYN38086.1 hypothetical protein K1T35_13100 [Pseudonocardia sp. DSM 110487]
MGVLYVGSGPYCYANSLAMVLGVDGPPPSAIEVLSGSPFGFHPGGGLAWFDPLGWDPDRGVDTALDLLGWTCERASGGSAADAVERLRAADGPVFVGPVEFGLLLHHPGSGQVLDSDHFMVVTAVTDGVVHFHDPHGFPFATLPVDEFVAAWESVTFEYPAEPFTMRSRFRRVREVPVTDALRASLPNARRLLDDGSAGAAVERFACLVAAGLSPRHEAHLVHFAVRVGARRLADAAVWLGRLGLAGAAVVAEEQARLVGGLQYPLVRGDRERVMELLGLLAPTYAALCAELAVADGVTT